MSKIALVMSDEFKAYNFGKFHPLKPERVLLTWDLIKGFKLHEHKNCEVIAPRLATDEELELLHTRDYISFVKKVTQLLEQGPLPEKEVIQGFKYNLGPGDNPVFPKMHEGSSIVVGGTLMAMQTVWEDNGIDKAFNAAGGLHHAMHNKASGFCIYNDPAIAILDLLQKKKDAKIVYIDVDAHHGDGVQAAFYNNPNVLTISIHESGKHLFPGTGEVDEIGKDLGTGFSVNIPLLPFTPDEQYLDIFDAIVPKIVRSFDPDLIVSQNGVDTHCTDPLTHLGLTTNAHKEIFSHIHKMADSYANGKLVAVGGGGYNISVVPRSWTMLFADLLGALEDIGNKIPDNILNRLNDGRNDELVPEYLVDPSPCEEVKLRKQSFKFLDQMDMHLNQIEYKILNTILPKIEKGII